MIPLSAPDIDEADIAEVVAVLRTPRLSLGPKLAQFEESVAGYVGVEHGVGVSSGTAGLHLSLLALGVEEGDEVILPSFTFIAAAHAVLYVRARPVFVDIDPVTLNMDPADVARKITPRTRALLVVHNFGYPADMDALLALAEQHHLSVIEDACEALGATHRGRKVGSLGHVGVFAFYPNKPITTGEGGMIVTRDRKLAETMRALRNQGRFPADGWLDHRTLGFNYRLSEMNCALGLSQMRRLEPILTRRETRALQYAEELWRVPKVTPPVMLATNIGLCWFVLVVRLAAMVDRDAVCATLTEQGIGCARYFAPIHRQPLYAEYSAGSLPVTDEVSSRTLALPFFTGISDEQIREVCNALERAVR